MGKYDALFEHLNGIPPDVKEITLSFEEIEKILGFQLPTSAHRHRAWWSNTFQGHPHAKAWLEAGWVVDRISPDSKQVRFRRSSRAHFEEKSQSLAENAFQNQVAELLSGYFGVSFGQNRPIAIGNPPKYHRFDLVSSDMRYIGECKDYSWTESGNAPSAKLAAVNEAIFYLSFLPRDVVRFVVMRRAVHPKRKETLAEYYYRTYRHLLQGILIQ